MKTVFHLLATSVAALALANCTAVIDPDPATTTTTTTSRTTDNPYIYGDAETTTVRETRKSY